MLEINSVLKSVGLTDAEIKTYLALLNHKSTTVGPLARVSGVSYSKIYIILNKLVDKGLASYTIKNKTKYFSPGNPKKLLDFAELKKKSIDMQVDQIKQILPKLIAKHSSSAQEERIELYEGFEGLKTIYEEGLSKMSLGTLVRVLGASFGEGMQNPKYSNFFRSISKIRKEKRLVYKCIFNEHFRGTKDIKDWQKPGNSHVRFLLEETPASINVQGDRTMIIYWKKEYPMVFFMQSKPIAESFKKYFEVIWLVAKP